MNYMNTLFKYILSGVIAISAAACNKSLELDVENPNRIDEPDFWQNADHALQGINAVYGNFYRNGPSRWLPYYLDVRSDDGYSTSPWNELRSISALSITDYSFEVQRETWDHHWRGVFRANQVLAYVPAIEMDATLKRSEERRVGKECRSRWSPY